MDLKKLSELHKALCDENRTEYSNSKRRLIHFITKLTPDDFECGHISATFSEDGNALIINFNDREEEDD